MVSLRTTIWVHLLAEPGNYVRRRVPPVFRAIRREGQTVVLESVGQGTLQWSEDPNGPWDELTNASPQTVTMDVARRFFRIVAGSPPPDLEMASLPHGNSINAGLTSSLPPACELLNKRLWDLMVRPWAH